MRSISRLAVVLAASIIPIVGLSGPANARHPKPRAHPQMLVTVSPNPLIETATSNVAAVIQIECNPNNCANNTITISSTQLTNHCAAGTVMYQTLLVGNLTRIVSPADPRTSINVITVTADNDGNATVVLTAQNCAPGVSLIVADLNAPPFYTATTKLTVQPPQVTAPGVRGFPPNEVQTGDGGTGQGAFGESDVYIVFYVETNPIWAEQIVSLTSDQLTARCGLGYRFEISDGTPAPPLSTTTGPSFNAVPNPPTIFSPPITGIIVKNTLDNDGNAVFIFKGASCAAGKSTVIADVQNNGQTYQTTYNILPPMVTI
jgi:hypothetical protein